MRKLGFIILVLLFINTSCNSSKKNDITNVIELEHKSLTLNKTANCDFELNPRTQSPLEFLQNLHWKENCNNGDLFIFHPDSIPDNWVKKEHLLLLIEQLESNELAFSVASIYASVKAFGNGYSTIGNEAYYLLLSYRTNSYPPYSTFNLGNSENDTTTLSLEDKSEMIEWWNSSDLSKHDFK